MAKAKNPLMSQEARGALGGIEYRQNQYGAVIGRRSITPHKRTPSQLEHRRKLSESAAIWTSLSDEIKSNWNTFAKSPLDGRTAFIAAKMKLSQATATPAADPNRSVPLSGISNFRAQIWGINPETILLEWDEDFSYDNLLLIYVAGTFSHRNNYTHSRMPFSIYANSNDASSLIYAPFKAPLYHIRIDAVNNYNGLILASWYLKFNATWP